MKLPTLKCPECGTPLVPQACGPFFIPEQAHQIGYTCPQCNGAPTEPKPAPPDSRPFIRALYGKYLPCDYPEDAENENGNYSNLCICGTEFIGHKRRVMCRVCATTPPEPAPAPAQTAREWLEKQNWDGRPTYQHWNIAAAIADRAEAEAKAADIRAEKLRGQCAGFQAQARAYMNDAETHSRKASELQEKVDILRRELELQTRETDSYGIPGSDFYICAYCEAESGAGMLNKGIPHESTCILYAPCTENHTSPTTSPPLSSPTSEELKS